MAVRIAGATQSYDWGKLGGESKVAELAAATPGPPLDAATPYAELWMGTHPSAPARVVGPHAGSLADLVRADPAAALGPDIARAYGNDLPFLFKVLSIRKALSIQAHPDKALAQRLHASRPDLYKDPNHKPEMAIALTEFEALCGFRPLDEIAANLAAFPEFAAVVGDAAQAFRSAVAVEGPAKDAKGKEALRTLFAAMMEADASVVAKQLAALVARLKAGKPALPGSVEELVVRLDSQFPGGDIGCFAVMMLNYIRLAPDQAIYLGANEPHAYLSGDCVECMAASDNVVRAGLTPKHKDVETLVAMLTYNYGPARDQVLEGDPVGKTGASRLYDPPIDEFSIVRTTLTPKVPTDEFAELAGPSILICTEGEAVLSAGGADVPAAKGHIFFVGAGCPVGFRLDRGSGATFYRAYCSMST
ncbi:mannose-6-phosphate isomerase [Hyaloraphidium curvatum]|nr:mannose-6-phosphate isomerase [Hyaloraphidium curvatum]